jgi:hypothetical protein
MFEQAGREVDAKLTPLNTPAPWTQNSGFIRKAWGETGAHGLYFSLKYATGTFVAWIELNVVP